MTEKPTTLLVVAAALVNDKNEVLVAQRPEGKRLAGRWEFPGGKVEMDESPEAAMARELKEELDIDVSIDALEPFWFLSHDYVSAYGFHLMMPVYLCRIWKGTPQAMEHAALTWKHPSKMHELDMIEADAELIARLASHLAPR